ncbi:MAG: hypothetical protein AB8V23_05415 [Candidatus Midichloria sp.]
MARLNILIKLSLTTSLLISINRSLNNAFAATMDLNRNSGGVNRMTNLELINGRQLKTAISLKGFFVE